VTKTDKDSAMRAINSCRVPGLAVNLLEPAEGELLIRTYDDWLLWKHAEEKRDPEPIHIPFEQAEQVVVAHVGQVSYLVGGNRAVSWPLAADARPLLLPFTLPFPANQFCPAPLQGVGDDWLFIEFDRNVEHWVLRKWRPLPGRAGSQVGALPGEVQTVARLLDSSQPAHLLVSADGKVVCVTHGGELWVVDGEEARRMTFCPSGHPMRESISSTRPLAAVFSLGTAVELIDTERLAVVDVLDFSTDAEKSGVTPEGVFLPDGTHLLVGTSRGLCIYNAQSQRFATLEEWPDARQLAIHLSRSGETVIVSVDGHVRVLSVEDLREAVRAAPATGTLASWLAPLPEDQARFGCAGAVLESLEADARNSCRRT
jgi:hypothetical protein